MITRRFFSRSICAAILASFGTFQPAVAGLKTIPEGSIVIIPVRQDVNDSLFLFIRRGLKEAERAKASGVVLDMDTNGGSVDSTRKIVESMMKTTTPMVTYVNTTAISAGALISLATNSVYMAPTSAVGAAAVVGGSGEDLGETMQDKATSILSAYFRSVAEQRGHRPEVATAFMDKSKGLKIGETVISGTGSVLSLSAGEAVRVIDGKTVFAKSIANSLDDVVKGEKWPGAVHVFEPTGFESVAFWLNTLAPLLLLVGLLAGYIEFKTPGFGIPGFISAICFLLFFSANYLAGLAGFELAVLFFLGFALVLIELLFFPGVLLLGVPGVLLMVACLLFAMVDAYPNQGLNIPLESFLGPMTTLAATILASGIIMAVIAKFLPKTPGLRHLVLASSVGDVKASIRRDASLGTEIGAVGTAITYLRPSGKGAFDGQVLDVITRGEFIPRDTAIRILRFDANAVVVEAVEAAS